MKIYLITSESNLTLLNDKLVGEYPKIRLMGSNSLHAGIEHVIKTHITEEYDLFLIMNQTFVEADLSSKKQLSDRLNKACLYALKDLPIYFMCNSKNKEYSEAIKASLTGSNIKLYQYKSLNMSDIEQIIKEVELLHKKKESSTKLVRQDIIEEKRKRIENGGSSYLTRVFDMRFKDSNENFTRLSKVKDIVMAYSSNTENAPKEFDNVSKIISEVKENLFSETRKPVVKDGIAVEAKVTPINLEYLSENLSVTSVKEKLERTSPEYNDYKQYMEELDEIIKKVSATDDENKHAQVVELIREKSYTNSKMSEMLASFVTQIAETSVKKATDYYDNEMNELHEFGKLTDIETLVGSRLEEITVLKERRELFKETVKDMTKQLTVTTNVINESLANTAKVYLDSNQQIENELIDYANKNNLPLTDVSIIKSDEVISTIKQKYNEVVDNVKNVINVSNATVMKFIELVSKDEEIIEKQGDVIDLMMTHKTKKVITVDNVLQTKLEAFYGLDGTGKTHSAYNLALAYSNFKRTLLVDLNIEQPSLHFYNRDRTGSTDFHFSSNTITLDNFIRIPLSKKMYEQLPFDNNLTIIQPTEKVDLIKYERTVNPSVFAIHVASFLEDLALFFDKIIVILPEDISMFGDIVNRVGFLHIVKDFEPVNTVKLKDLLTNVEKSFDKIPIKNLVINKLSKGITQSPEASMKEIGLDIKDFNYVQIPLFIESPSYKLEGKNPYASNLSIRKQFDTIIKKLN